jgi:uncharacterized tellurite resistance protein B-like protein
MLDAIRRFVAELGLGEAPHPLDENDHRLAAAALLHHVIAVDGEVSEEETARLRQVLMRQFALDGDDAERLMEEAEAADLESVDLYSFTSVLKRRLDEAGRERVIAMMWQMVYADGVVNEFEDNVVWRVAELLGISNRDRIRLKKAVQDGRLS